MDTMDFSEIRYDPRSGAGGPDGTTHTLVFDEDYGQTGNIFTYQAKNIVNPQSMAAS